MIGITILTLFSVIFGVTALIPFIRTGFWGVRGLDFPRMHCILMNLGLAAIWLSFEWTPTLQFSMVALLVVAIGSDAYRIYRYLPFFKKESVRLSDAKKTKAASLRLFTSNVRTKNDKYHLLLQEIKKEDPDFIVLVEADDTWLENTKQLEETYPYTFFRPNRNTYGMLIYSRLKLIEPEAMYLVDDDVVSIKTGVALKNKQLVNVFCLHPRPPRPKEGPSDQRDAELMMASTEIANDKGHWLVVGDLNDVAWSHTTRLFLRTSGMLDPRRGRGFFNTFPAGFSAIGFPLDHIFHTESLFVEDFRKLSNIGSDHLPMIAEFYLDPEAKQLQKPHETSEVDDHIEKVEYLRNGQEWEGPNQKVDGYD